ncbi:MAG: hypothetical protein PUF13_10820 [Lachnospiraceae bacterium]|nr:hypothetical protein [Lachnospiraceae bacterium]
MGTTSFNGMLDMIILAFGIYILYACVSMKTTGAIKGGMMLPKGMDPRHCKDPAGYIAFACPRLAVVGVISVICGVLGFMMDFFLLVSGTVYCIAMLIFLISLIWYTVVSKKAIREFWGLKK